MNPMEDEQQQVVQEASVRQEALRAALAHLQRAQSLLQSPLPPPNMPLQVEDLLDAAIADLRQALGEAQGSPNSPPGV